MTTTDDLEVAIGLACLTEDRTDAEQRALLRLADKVDHARNKNTVTNVPVDPPSVLYDLVQATRLIEEGQRRVELKNRKGPPRP